MSESTTQFKRPVGWELMPAGMLVKRICVISLAAAVLGAIPIVALYHLRDVPHIVQVLFYTSVCSAIMTALIAGSLIRFGRWMYLRPFPLNWILLCGTMLAGTSIGSLIAN